MFFMSWSEALGWGTLIVAALTLPRSLLIIGGGYIGAESGDK